LEKKGVNRIRYVTKTLESKLEMLKTLTEIPKGYVSRIWEVFRQKKYTVINSTIALQDCKRELIYPLKIMGTVARQKMPNS